VLVYATVAFLWIAFSDRALEAIVRDPHRQAQLQTIKGWAFVIATASLLYPLLRRTEASLHALDREIRATVDSMADAVMVVDRSARIVEMNRAAVEMFGGRTKEELLLPLAEWGARVRLRTPDGRPLPLERYATIRALAGERVERYEALITRPDSRDVYLGISAAPVAESGRRPRLAVAILRDVSAARQLDEARDEFLATAAHEFKTPLAVIKAYAQLMAAREPSEARALAVIQRQVDRLTRLVQQVLDASRSEIEAPPRPVRFDLGALAEEVVASIRATAPRHQLSVAAEGEAAVLADRDRIARVISSLVENGIRFSPSGGPVETRVVRRGGEAILSVVDRGVGIPSARQDRIFERYYRAHAGTPEDYGGFGLGLDLSREIVTRNGGRMWFESEPGQGSIFHFALPLARTGEAVS
jgi:PAS domain S-box-containing protein